MDPAIDRWPGLYEDFSGECEPLKWSIHVEIMVIFNQTIYMFDNLTIKSCDRFDKIP